MQKFVIIVFFSLIAIACSQQKKAGEAEQPSEDSAKEPNLETISQEEEVVTADSVYDMAEAETGENESEEESDCIFDQSIQTDDFIKKVPEFANYTWNDTTKMATIKLPGGEVLLATRGGCNHFGISGKWIKRGRDHGVEDVDYWLEQGAWISKRILPEADFASYEKMVQNKEYETTLNDGLLYVLFNDPAYSEWSLTVQQSPEQDSAVTIIETGYYFN